MASLISSFRTPQCLSCLRRVTAFKYGVTSTSSQHQVRGKKTTAMPTTVKVRLLKDVRRYGRGGTIITVAAGRMRNNLYPRRLAEYVTLAQLRELGLEDAILERDSTFGIGQAQPEAVDLEEPVEVFRPTPRSVEVELLAPERAMKVVEMLVPDNLDFYRSPIETIASVPRRMSPSIPASSSLSDAAIEAAAEKAPQKTAIYGSVSTADIVANLKAILAEDDEGVRVVLSPEDITFVEEGDEKDRVKQLGIFEINIMLKGATDVIRRTIRVSAQG